MAPNKSIKATAEQIAGVVAKFHQTDTTKWTKTGDPSIPAITAELGLAPTAITRVQVQEATARVQSSPPENAPPESTDETQDGESTPEMTANLTAGQLGNIIKSAETPTAGQQADKMLADAKKERDKILADARKEAAKIKTPPAESTPETPAEPRELCTVMQEGGVRVNEPDVEYAQLKDRVHVSRETLEILLSVNAVEHLENPNDMQLESAINPPIPEPTNDPAW